MRHTSSKESRSSSDFATVIRDLGVVMETLKSVRCEHAHSWVAANSHPGPAKACASSTHQHSNALAGDEMLHSEPAQAS